MDVSLRSAVIDGSLDTVKTLIQEQSQDVYDQALDMAAEIGNVPLVEYLIENGADIHYCNDSPLRMAAGTGFLDVVLVLIKHGADLHAYDNQALVFAVENDYPLVVKALLEHGAHVNGHAIQVAIENKSKEMIDILVSALNDMSNTW